MGAVKKSHEYNIPLKVRRVPFFEKITRSRNGMKSFCDKYSKTAIYCGWYWGVFFAHRNKISAFICRKVLYTHFGAGWWFFDYSKNY